MQKVSAEVLEFRRQYRTEQITERIQKTGLPSRWQNIAFSVDLDTPVIPSFLYGVCGCGKTHTMACMIYQLICQAYDLQAQPGKGGLRMPVIQFVSASLLLQQLRESFGPNPAIQEGEIIRKYTQLDWLFLDDLGAEKITDWVRASFYLIVNQLYDNEKNLVLSSNLSLKEIAEAYDDRISSRVREMCKVVKVAGKDRRAK